MKSSSYIQIPEACSFIEAGKEAVRLETPWNCFIGINLEQAGIEPKSASKHARNGIKRLRKYHHRNGMPFSYGWVLENAHSVGVHLHLLVHRPHKLPMSPMKYWWSVLRAFQIKRSKGVLKVEKFRHGQTYGENIMQVASYCLKGLRAGSEKRFEEITGLKLAKDLKHQGYIYGKRIGWSQKPRARKSKRAAKPLYSEAVASAYKSPLLQALERTEAVGRRRSPVIAGNGNKREATASPAPSAIKTMLEKREAYIRKVMCKK